MRSSDCELCTDRYRPKICISVTTSATILSWLPESADQSDNNHFGYQAGFPRPPGPQELGHVNTSVYIGSYRELPLLNPDVQEGKLPVLYSTNSYAVKLYITLTCDCTPSNQPCLKYGSHRTGDGAEHKFGGRGLGEAGSRVGGCSHRKAAFTGRQQVWDVYALAAAGSGACVQATSLIMSGATY